MLLFNDIQSFVRVPTISLPPEGGTTLYGQLPALLRAKISVAFSLSNACFLQIKSLHTTHNVPNEGTHYSKKWCKVTHFLPNNMFPKEYFSLNTEKNLYF